MATWEVEATPHFERWYHACDDDAQVAIEAAVELLVISGPLLGRPAVDTVRGSRFRNMKELRIQCGGRPLRVFFAFDPTRTAVLLIGGDKTGNARFYDEFIPLADRLFAKHLDEIGESDA